MTEAELVALWAPSIRRMARGCGWWICGAELEDLEQEALIGLLLAARSWRPELGPFSAFARLCAQRRMLDAIKTANRHKHRVLSDASREATAPSGHAIPAYEVAEVADQSPTLETQVARREAIGTILSAVEGFSQVERQALVGWLEGRPYAELGQPKHIDNALQRGKRKLRAALAA